MCLAIPGKLIEISEDAQGVRMGKANFGGIVKQVCLEYTPEVEIGDYVLVHVGFALEQSRRRASGANLQGARAIAAVGRTRYSRRRRCRSGEAIF